MIEIGKPIQVAVKKRVFPMNVFADIDSAGAEMIKKRLEGDDLMLWNVAPVVEDNINFRMSPAEAIPEILVKLISDFDYDVITFIGFAFGLDVDADYG